MKKIKIYYSPDKCINKIIELRDELENKDDDFFDMEEDCRIFTKKKRGIL